MKLKKRAKNKDFSFRNLFRIYKRGQITYFIIVGILIIIIMGFFVYMKVSTIKKRTEKEVVRVKEQAVSTQQVETYVTECLRRLLFKSLDYVGHQGGRIFNIQESGLSFDTEIKQIKCKDTNPIDCKTPDPTNAYQVPYALFEPTNIYGTKLFPPEFPSTSPPFYPWGVFPYQPTSTSPYPPDISKGKTFKATVFGRRDMPGLDKESECILEDKPNSINCQIESYIYRNIDGISQDDTSLGGKDYCLYFGDLNDPGEFIGTFKEQGYEIKGPYEKTAGNYKRTGLGNKYVNVTISDDDVNVYLIYPLEIKDIATGKTVIIKDFHANANVRLGKLYKFTKELIGTDKFDVKFDIDSKKGSGDYNVGYGSVPYYDAGIEVSLIENVDAKDDFVQVEDDISLLEGNPYKFWVVRKNRRPALEYITTVNIDGTDKPITPAQSLPASRVIHLQENSKIIIDNIKAFDPDEDDLTNKYEVYVYEYFDGKKVKIVNGYPMPISKNKWEKEINKGLGKLKPGVYNITILVKDDSGLEDFQIILAKVNTRPVITNIKFDKQLKDINGNSINQISCGGKAISKKQTIKFTADVDDPDDYSKYAPDPIFSEGLSMNDALNYLWELSTTKETNDKFTYDFKNTGTYTIDLTVTDSSGATASCSFEIEVKENQKPTASIKPSTTQKVSSGTKIWFTGTGKDNDGKIVGYKWDRDDDKSDCEKTPSSWRTPSKGKAGTISETKDYTFSSTRYVCFHVIDDDGATDVATVKIKVK